jgi:hypothetical protein
VRSADALAAIERAMDAQLRALTALTEKQRGRVVRAMLDSVYDTVGDKRPRLPTIQGYQAIKARRDLGERIADDPSLLREPVAVLARLVTADRRSVRAWLRKSGVPGQNSREGGTR